MSAPNKAGLDYYPRSVDLLKDRKLIKAKLEYGYLAIAVYDALLEMIYKDKGYYLDYNENTKDAVIYDIMSSLNGKYHLEPATLSKVVEMLVACELFSGDHFKQGVITGKRIQETYYRATVERKNVEVLPELWMLSTDDMKGLSGKSSILSFFVNRTINRDNQPINEVNQPIKKQSKVNKSKVNNNIYISPTLTEVQAFVKDTNGIVDAEEFYNSYQAKGWKIHGDKITDWQAKYREWEKNEQKKPQTGYKNRFINYDQPTYTDEQWEMIMERNAKKR